MVQSTNKIDWQDQGLTSPVLYFVVPCYNEEDAIAETAAQLISKTSELVTNGKISAQSKVLLVDDGSADATWPIICVLAQESGAIEGLRLAKNYGQQVALYAGMLEAAASCDMCITLDADGQHSLNAVDAMLEAFADGCEVVYAAKANPRQDPLWKRLTSSAYHSVLALQGARTVKNHADYRLVSAHAIHLIADMPKTVVFLRNDFSKLGLPSAVVPYECRPRMAGKSKYSLGKMISLACDGFASVSSKPGTNTVDFAIADRV
ncbi:MAG: glycosyltransferase [Eggerthellaceae bacterium]|nr:glycosyltransferase [Eggerthellaceae bacterium]